MKSKQYLNYLVLTDAAGLSEDEVFNLLGKPDMYKLDYRNKDNEDHNKVGWALVAGAYFCGADRDEKYSVYSIAGMPKSSFLKVATNNHFAKYPSLDRKELEYLSRLGEWDMAMDTSRNVLMRKDRSLTSNIEEFIGKGRIYSECKPMIDSYIQSGEKILQDLYGVVQKDAVYLMRNQW